MKAFSSFILFAFFIFNNYAISQIPDSSKSGYKIVETNFQNNVTDKKTDTVKNDSTNKIGIFLGFSQICLSGEYLNPATTCDYSFGGGKGSEFSISIFYSKMLDSTFEIFTYLGYRTRLLNMTTNKARLTPIRGEKDPQMVNYEANLDAKFSYWDFHVLLKSKLILNDLYIMAGFGVFYNFSNELTVKETIKDDRYVFRDTYLNWGDIYPTGKFPNLNSLTYTADFGLSYELYIAADFGITAALLYSHSLNNIEDNNSLKISSTSLRIGVLKLF